MKNCVVYLILLAAIGIGGCRPQRSVVKVEEKKETEVRVVTEQIKAPNLEGRLLIEQICDTVEIEVEGKIYKAPGKAREFDYETIIDSLKATISVRENALQVSVNQTEQIRLEKERIEQTLREQIKESESTVKSRLSLKWLLVSLGIGFALGYFRPWRLL